MATQAVSRKLLLVFALQVASISFAVVCGVFASAKILEDSLIRRVLQEEATLFAARLSDDPTIDAPETVNLSAYLAGRDRERVPQQLRGLEPGFHKVTVNDERMLVLVQPVGGDQMVMQFRQERVTELALFFGLLPLALVLLVVYATSWIAYRLSRQTVSPIVGLAREVEQLDLDNVEPDVFDSERFVDLGQEVQSLADALRRLAERIQQMLARERAFTRDASHELRTPLTVIQMAAEMLIDDENLDEFERRNARRIRLAAREMKAMLEALLVLARNDARRLEHKRFVVNEVVETEIERSRFLTINREVELKIEDEARISLTGVPTALAILVGHLIRRVSGSISQGTIAIHIGDGYVSVEGRADSEAASTRGPIQRCSECTPGETIIDRLSQAFTWPVVVEEEANGETRAAVHFPEYEYHEERNTAHA